jgi:hypothetical protein
MDVQIRNKDGSRWVCHGVPGVIEIRSALTTHLPLAPGPAASSKRGRRARAQRAIPVGEIETIVERVVGWRGFFKKGRPLDCTQHVLVALLEAAPWVRKQLSDAIAALDASGVI